MRALSRKKCVCQSIHNFTGVFTMISFCQVLFAILMRVWCTNRQTRILGLVWSESASCFGYRMIWSHGILALSGFFCSHGLSGLVIYFHFKCLVGHESMSNWFDQSISMWNWFNQSICNRVYLYIYNRQYIGQTCSCILFICANFATTAFSLSKLEFNFTLLTYGKNQLQRNPSVYIHTQISAPLWQMHVAKNLEQGRAFV